MFIGTVESVEPQFFDPWALALRQRIPGHFSEEDLERMAEDKTPAGLAKLKETYVQMLPDLPEPYRGQLARARTHDQLEALFNSLIEDGRRAHLKVKEEFRGAKRGLHRSVVRFQRLWISFSNGRNLSGIRWPRQR